MYVTLQLAGKGCKDSDYTIMIMKWHKRIIIGLKLTLGVETQVLLSSRQLDRSLRRWLPVQLWRIAHKGSDHTTTMAVLRCQPLRQCCEWCNNVLSLFWSPWLARTWQHGHCVTWVLIGTSHKLAIYNIYEQPHALSYVWVRAGGCKWRYPKGLSRTCYQECGCHL